MKFLVAVALLVVAANADKCVFPCPMILKPVCGNDGNTYPNECAMRGAACRKGEAIVMVRARKCAEGGIEKRCTFPCFLLLKPVCGSDGMVYSNECMLRGSSCKSGKPITVVYDKLNIQESKTHQETCNKCAFSCTRIFDPVCGSDGKTHPSQCEMNRMACKERKAITMIYKGKCRE